MSVHNDPTVPDSADSPSVPFEEYDEITDALADVENVAEEGYLRCDLCNKVVDELKPHQELEHREIFSFLGDTLLNHSEPIVVSEKNKHLLGEFAHTSTRSLDKGPEIFTVIQNIAAEFDACLQHFGSFHAHVFLFGSCISMGMWDGEGDADFTVFSSAHDQETGAISARKEKELVLGLSRRLKDIGFLYEELEVLTRTRIPVVRRKCGGKSSTSPSSYAIQFSFERECDVRDKKQLYKKYNVDDKIARRGDGFTQEFESGIAAVTAYARREAGGVRKTFIREPEIFHIDFDLSCRLHGVRNSWLIRRYMEQDPLFRAGLCLLKKWSKNCCINNSFRGYLTSYAVTVLWLAYLLHAKAATFVPPDTIPLVPATTQKHFTYLPLWDCGDVAAAEQKLGTLLSDFFSYYDSFDWENCAVTIRNETGVVSRQQLGWEAEREIDGLVLSKRIFYGISIEDVYEDELNLGRHLSPIKQLWVKAQFHRAVQLCGSGDFASLFDPIADNASDALRRELLAHLLHAHSHCCTVGQIRSFMPPVLLSAYELGNRLSDLWFYKQKLLDDEEKRVLHNLRNTEPTVCSLSAGQWSAVSDDVFFPADSNKGDDERVIHLVKEGLNYSSDGAAPDVPASGCQSTFGSIVSEVSKRCAEYQQLFAVNSSAFIDVSDAPERGLLVQLFPSVGGSFIFSSGEEAKKFEKTLKAAFNVVQLLKDDQKPPTSFEAWVTAVRSHGSVLSSSPHEEFPEAALTGIFKCPLFFELRAGRPKPTLFFSKLYPIDQTIKTPRSKLGLTASKGKTTAIRKNAKGKKMGTCSGCGKTRIAIFPTTAPQLDNGYYCQSCWDEYV